jgi:hypothetical protein
MRSAIMTITKLTLSSLSLQELKQFVQLQEGKVGTYSWNQVEHLPLSPRQQQQLQDVISHLVNRDTTLMNEATIWARAIYPLLLLAESNDIEAWAQVVLSAEYPAFAIEGIADGVLGRNVAGRLEAPYLIVLEAKRGIDAQTPVYQLYGQLLAAARLNWELDGKTPQEIFGCYTIADTWKFLRAEVEGIDTEKPTLRLEYSREYFEKLEAETIFKILTTIVAHYQ